MGYSDEFLKDSLLSEESMLLDLEELVGYYTAMHVESHIIPAAEATPMPTLAAMLQKDDRDRQRVIVHSFQPYEREEAEYTKYLQFYAELPCELEGLAPETLLSFVCRVNQALPLGFCFPVPPRPALGLGQMIGVRSIQGFPITESIDQGVFTEDTILFNLSCELVSMRLDAMAEGKTLDEAFAPSEE